MNELLSEQCVGCGTGDPSTGRDGYCFDCLVILGLFDDAEPDPVLDGRSCGF